MVVSISPEELHTLVAESGSIELIDVRNPDEWDTGHIPGARLVPLEQFRSDPDAVLSRGTTLVFICAKGVRSMQAAKLAERFGYDNIYNLDGGTKEWARRGLALAVDTRAAA